MFDSHQPIIRYCKRLKIESPSIMHSAPEGQSPFIRSALPVHLNACSSRIPCPSSIVVSSDTRRKATNNNHPKTDVFQWLETHSSPSIRTTVRSTARNVLLYKTLQTKTAIATTKTRFNREEKLLKLNSGTCSCRVFSFV